jgi:hypothetical protein
MSGLPSDHPKGWFTVLAAVVLERPGGAYFRTGNAATKFGQLDEYVALRTQASATATLPSPT